MFNNHDVYALMVRPARCRVHRSGRISPNRALVNPYAPAGSVTPLHLDQTCRIRSPAAIYSHRLISLNTPTCGMEGLGPSTAAPGLRRACIDWAASPKLRFDEITRRFRPPEAGIPLRPSILAPPEPRTSSLLLYSPTEAVDGPGSAVGGAQYLHPKCGR